MDVARAAAGSKERAAEVAKELRGVQKAQQREFGRRMQENRRTANQNAEVQQMTELQRQNARAEKLLDQNLETLVWMFQCGQPERKADSAAGKL